MKNVNLLSSSRTPTGILLAAAISFAAGQSLPAQCVGPCPAGATDSGVGVGVAAFRINPDGSTGTAIGSGTVGGCQCIRLRMSISYAPFGPSGGTTAAFSGGQLVIQTSSGSFSQDVTPAGGVPIIGPPGADCNPATNFFLSTITSDFCISNHLADIVGGKISFIAKYGPTGTVAYFCPPITNQMAGATPIQVNVAPAPTCTVTPATNGICSGGSASFTVTPGGSGPFRFSWSGPNGFTSSNSTITISNATAANAGVYTATVFDTFGCPTTCSGTLSVFPNPACAISPQAVTNCLDINPCTTFTVTPSLGTAPYTIVVTGPGVNVTNVTSTSATFTGCASNSPNVYTAIVTDAHGCTTSCQATQYGILCRPGIAVFKQVVCYSNLCAFDSNLNNQKTAVGVSFDGQCPAFCYRITVTNTGDVPLTSLTVADSSVPGPNLNLSGCGFPSTLPVGGSASCVVQDVSRCASDTNIVTATASGQTGAGTSGTVTARDTNSVTVIPISVACHKLVTSPDDTDGSATDNHVLLVNDGRSHSVTYSLTVTNTGAANLANVTVRDPVLAGLGCPPPAPFSLAAGASTNFSCAVFVNCTNVPAGGLFDTAAVSGQTDASTGACGRDTNGLPITATSQCSSLVECTNPCVLSVTKTACIITAPAPCNPLTTCTPPYPFASSNALTSVVFNESEVLRAFTATITNDCTAKQIRVWYNDEHALTLGIRQVVVKTASGTTTNNYPITAMTSPTSPDSAFNPMVGSTNQTGDQAGTDLAGRPIAPALYITDITSDPNSLAGDWQFGGTAIPPHAVFGTWKGAVRTVDETRVPAVVTVTPDADPTQNHWNVDGGDPVPAGLTDQGYGAEVRWDVDRLGLIPGHTYRLYFMVHDGDQNKSGGDVGHGCAILNLASTNSVVGDCLNTFTGPDCVPVRYTYVISNTGRSPALNVRVFDDKLGDVPGSPIALIPPGGSVTLTATNVVCCTVTNVVVVTSADGRCSATAQASVGKCNPLTACTPPYPFASSNALTSVPFNESEVLRSFTVSVTNDCFPKQIRVWYNDEHALTLGIRQVVVKTASGSVTNNYPITAMTTQTDADSAFNPLVGSTNLTGDQAGTDLSGRPIFPALFLTDITTNANSLAGDWQFGGIAIPPHAVFGTWKGAVRTVDETHAPAVVTVTPDADPTQNHWNVDGGDSVPTNLVDQGYGAEVRWDVDRLGLIAGHTYRLYFMVHDGDQNQSGGDVGQGCAVLGVGTQTVCPPPPCNPLTTCTPPYPFASSNALTSVPFNESEVLRTNTVSVTNDCFPTQIRLWYNDEHALTLGIRQVIVKTSTGFVTNDYQNQFTSMPTTTQPSGALNPMVGTTAQGGDQAGTDVAGRPIFPALFITDLTTSTNPLAGDWQSGGVAYPPNAVFGTWKGAVRTVDKTKVPTVVTVTPDADPTQNHWNVDGGDPVPAGLTDQGYGAEVRWDVASLGLIPGHSYRLYFMVHDGDQNHSGGDVGQGCSILNLPCTGCATNFRVAPAIVTQPQSQMALAGESVMFNVVAAGSAPLAYQWLLNATNVTGANGPSLMVDNVAPQAVGTYSVQVSNPAGVVLSAGATLAIVPPPIPTLAVSTTAGSLVFSWSAGSPGYQLQTANDLSGVWTTVTNAPQLVGDLYVLTVTTGTGPQQFFRLLKQ